jgi:fatty acid desaturase
MDGAPRSSRQALSRQEIDALARPSDCSGLARLTGHLTALGAAIVLVALIPEPLWRLPAQALEGAILVFLFAPLHEAVHRTAFRSRRLNDAVASVVGVLILLPSGYFRAFHFAHHRHTQNPARDPELATPKPRDRREFLWRASGLPLWRDLARTLLRHAAGRVPEPFLADGAARRVIGEARVHVLIYAAVAGASLVAGSDAAIRFWILPALLGQPWLRLFLMAEHTLCPLVPDMLANTRTTLTNRFVRFFAWNMPFHAEHHAFPAVPFHALPDAHRQLAPRIRTIAPGYVAFHAELVRTLGAGPRRRSKAG